MASAMPRSSDSGPGWAPGHVDEGHDRQSESLGELHDPHRLAIALGVRHPEVAPDVLVGVGALLLADDDDRPAVERREPGDHRLVVAEEAVAVQLDEPVGHRRDELERPRPPQVARQLDAGPGAVVRAVERRAVPGSVRAAARRRFRAASPPEASPPVSSPTRSASVDRNESGRNPPASPVDSGTTAYPLRTGSCRRRPISSSRSSGAGHDPVDEAVTEQELGPLEARRQLLGDGPGLDPGAGEADERVRLGDVHVARRPRTRRRRHRSWGRRGPRGTGRRPSAAARSRRASWPAASGPACPPASARRPRRSPR